MADTKKAKKKASAKRATKTAPKLARKKTVKKVAKKVAKKAAKRVSRPSPPAEPTQEEIARLAYELWERRGRPFGSSDEDWRRADEELRRRAREGAKA